MPYSPDKAHTYTHICSSTCMNVFLVFTNQTHDLTVARTHLCTDRHFLSQTAQRPDSLTHGKKVQNKKILRAFTHLATKRPSNGSLATIHTDRTYHKLLK